MVSAAGGTHTRVPGRPLMTLPYGKFVKGYPEASPEEMMILTWGSSVWCVGAVGGLSRRVGDGAPYGNSCNRQRPRLG